jgi:hypothetical protein
VLILKTKELVGLIMKTKDLENPILKIKSLVEFPKNRGAALGCAFAESEVSSTLSV